MTDQQFDRLLEKLDWIGFALEGLAQRLQDTLNYPIPVEVRERHR